MAKLRFQPRKNRSAPNPPCSERAGRRNAIHKRQIDSLNGVPVRAPQSARRLRGGESTTVERGLRPTIGMSETLPYSITGSLSVNRGTAAGWKE